MLENAWAFYFDDEAKRTQVHSSSAALAAATPAASPAASLIGLVQSIPQFWLHFNRVDASLSKLCAPDGTASQGRFEIKFWKKLDAAGNPLGTAAAAAASRDAPVSCSSSPHSGGKWILKSTPSNDLVVTRLIWRELLMALVGEQLPLASTVVGCVLACRPHRNELQLWVNQAPYAALPVVPSSPQEDQRRRAALAAAAAAHPAGASEGDAAAAAAQQLALVNQQSHDLKLRAIATSMRRLLNLQDGVRISYVPHSYELEKSKARAAQADQASASKRSSSSSRHRRDHRSIHSGSSSDAVAAVGGLSSVLSAGVASATSSTHSTPPRPDRDRDRDRDRTDRSDRDERAKRSDRMDRERAAARESDRADRAKLRAVQAKTTKAQTWPIRPPEQFMAPPPPPEMLHVDTTDETVAASALSVDPGVQPSVDPGLFAALSLSAYPLPEPDSALSNSSSVRSSSVMFDEHSTSPASALVLTSETSSNSPTSARGHVSHLPPSQLTSPMAAALPDFQRFLIPKDTHVATNSAPGALSSQSAPASSVAAQSALSAGPTSGAQSASPARTVRELGAAVPLASSLHSPLANLLGLTSLPNAQTQQQTPPRANGSFSPASAPTRQSAASALIHATPPRALHLDSAAAALLHACIPLPPGLPVPPSDTSTPGSASKSLLHPGVHVLNSNGRPSAVAGSGSLVLRSSVSDQPRMSKGEKAQATAWLERVQAKQEQAKSWPHVQSQPQPVVVAHHQTTQAHNAPAPLARNLALNLAHVQHRGPNSIPLIPHPALSSITGAASISTTASASGGSSAKVSPRISSSSNTELVLRARTEAQSRQGSVSLSNQSGGSGAHSNADSGVTSAADSGLLAASTQAPSMQPVLPLPPPAVPASCCTTSPSGLSATQIFSAGSLPVLQLTERVLSSDLDDASDSKVSVDPPVSSSADARGPSAATRRARSRSLFFTGHFTHGPGGSVHTHGSSTGTGSPFAAPNGMLVSPLLTAFKDQSNALAQMRARGLSFEDMEAESSTTKPVLVSTSESPPMSVLHLGSPSVISAPPNSTVLLPAAALVLSSAAAPQSLPSASSPPADPSLSFNIHVTRCEQSEPDPLLPSPSSGHADPPAASEEDDAVITPSSQPGHAGYSSTISAFASSNPNPFTLYPLSSDASSSPPLTEWERTTRPLEHGLPPSNAAAGMYGATSGFKPMSRAERKAALAMLSKVSSKRLKAQSWPRLMMHPGTGTGASPSPGQTPGGGLSPLPAGDSPSMSGSVSPLPPSAGGRTSANGGTVKPFAATNLSIDLRATPVGPRTPAPADAALLHSTRRVNPFSPNPHASPPAPISRSISSQEQAAYPQPPSGSSTPSGTVTPGGGTRVTLGMGLRSRTKSSINISAGGGMSPGPFASPPPLFNHRLSIGGSYTPIASGQPSPALSPSFGPSSARGTNSSGGAGFPSQSAPPPSVHAQASPSPISSLAAAQSFGSLAPLHRRQASGSATAVAALGPPLATTGSTLGSPFMQLRKLSGGPPTPPVAVHASSAASPSTPLSGTEVSPLLRVRGVGVGLGLGVSSSMSPPGSREGSLFVGGGSPAGLVQRRLQPAAGTGTGAVAAQAATAPAAPAPTHAPPPPPPSTRPLYVIICLLVLLLVALSAMMLHTQREAALRSEMQINMLRQEMAAAQAQAAALAAAAGGGRAHGTLPPDAPMP